MACATHAPLFWTSEPPLTFAHTPLPKSSSATLNPSTSFIFNSCRTHNPDVPEVFLARGPIIEAAHLIVVQCLVELPEELFLNRRTLRPGSA
jgi:hypothetical protein